MEEPPQPGLIVHHPRWEDGVVLVAADTPPAGCVPVMFLGPPPIAKYVRWASLFEGPPADILVVSKEDENTLLGQFLEAQGVENCGHYFLFEYEGRWEPVVEWLDGEQFDLPKSFASAGEALNYMRSWAMARGLIVTSPDGQIRQYARS